MTREVQVRRLLENGYAEVFMERPTACSGDCHHCAGGCTAAREIIVVRARNLIGAKPGDKVLLELSARQMLKISLLTYFVPIILFFLGWFLGSLVGLAPWCGGAGFALGVGFILWLNKRLEKRKTVQYRIVEYV